MELEGEGEEDDPVACGGKLVAKHVQALLTLLALFAQPFNQLGVGFGVRIEPIEVAEERREIGMVYCPQNEAMEVM